MSQFFQIHPDNPQVRLIRQAVEIVRAGGVIVYPTDSSYAIGCHIGDKMAMDRIRQIRRLGDDHNFTLIGRSLSELSAYTKLDNQAHRLIKNLTPGPYTFILKATKQVPKRLMHAKRKTIGVRIPDNRVALALLDELNEPLLSSTLILPGDDMPMTDPYDMNQTLGHAVDLIIDGGYCGLEPTSVVDLHEDVPRVLRVGWASVVRQEGASAQRVAGSSGAPETPLERSPWLPLRHAVALDTSADWMPQLWRDLDTALAAAPLGDPGTALVLGRAGGPEFLASEVNRLGYLAGVVASLLR